MSNNCSVTVVVLLVTPLPEQRIPDWTYHAPLSGWDQRILFLAPPPGMFCLAFLADHAPIYFLWTFWVHVLPINECIPIFEPLNILSTCITNTRMYSYFWTRCTQSYYPWSSRSSSSSKICINMTITSSGWHLRDEIRLWGKIIFRRNFIFTSKMI